MQRYCKDTKKIQFLLSVTHYPVSPYTDVENTSENGRREDEGKDEEIYGTMRAI